MVNHTMTNTKVFTVENAIQAERRIQELVREGYNKDNLYVLAHDNDRTERVAEQTNASKIGVAEEGILTTIGNLFRSHGDTLRAKMRSMGVSKQYADILESELDKGKIVILAWNGVSYEGDRYDSEVTYFPPYL
ncbi:general stress protein [Paenibacillus sp. UMB4589-SE434]|uniref:general stress protein n=1 Tax=Paenibacillus sp. UMB4589-SE434 TaxID=3046314 RepID=UPI00254A502A|nr:general stress protein [Paenibacillus sp. UMB4589-SE434]MDK8183487.1 general stress protein [Paenibacillus sp. UMB4589-SE434]